MENIAGEHDSFSYCAPLLRVCINDQMLLVLCCFVIWNSAIFLFIWVKSFQHMTYFFFLPLFFSILCFPEHFLFTSFLSALRPGDFVILLAYFHQRSVCIM